MFKVAIFSAFFILFAICDVLSQTSITGEISIKIASKKRDCEGGIGFRCGSEKSISFSHTYQFRLRENADPREVVAYLSKKSENELQFSIKKNGGIRQELYNELFAGRKQFVTEEDWQVPDNYLTGLGFTNEFLVRAGLYQMTEDDKFIHITFSR